MVDLTIINGVLNQASTLAAWIGAIGTVWQIITRSKPLHKVKVFVSNAFTTNNAGRISEPLFLVIVVNEGRDSIDVEGWSIRLPRGKQFVHFRPFPMSSSLPARLEPGTSLKFYGDHESLKRELAGAKISHRNLVAEIVLATGKRVRSKQRLKI